MHHRYALNPFMPKAHSYNWHFTAYLVKEVSPSVEPSSRSCVLSNFENLLSKKERVFFKMVGAYGP